MHLLNEIISVLLTALGIFTIIVPKKAVKGQALTVAACMKILGFTCEINPTPRAAVVARIVSIVGVSVSIFIYIKQM